MTIQSNFATVALVSSDHEDPNVRSTPVGKLVAPGQWYWVIEDKRRPDDEDEGEAADAAAGESNDGNSAVTVRVEGEYTGTLELDGRRAWLGCVMKVGSNYVELRSPETGSGYTYTRVHFDNFWTHLVIEPAADRVIQTRRQRAERTVRVKLKEIEAVQARLGMRQADAVTDARRQEQGSLVVLSAERNIEGYKDSLIAAKETELPALFAAVEKAHKSLVRWLKADSLPMEAMSLGMKDSIALIDSRIFTISLYAGLCEQIVLCRDGKPAEAHEKLRVMQSLLFMDEECLMNYQAGGMSFGQIEDFDAWLSAPDNFERLLPFPRCIVSMRVRRNKKEREWDGTISGALVLFELKQQDEFTFLYIRNGEQLHRLSTEMEFDETLFPNREDFDPFEPMMFRVHCGDVSKFMSRSAYDQEVDELRAQRRLAAKWKRDNPEAEWKKAHPRESWHHANPHHVDRWRTIEGDEWHPFDPSSVYYDDAATAIAERVAKYNRIATLIQGIYDRSSVLHPHPTVQTWTAQGFAAAIKLVYDAAHTLHNGEAPDWEAYRAECNAQITPTSVLVGQNEVWLRKEAERENERLRNDWRFRGEKRYVDRFHPYGNPGPGYIAIPEVWKPRSKQAVFTWTKERRASSANGWSREPVRCTITASAGQLFNVSAYKPGDYRRFLGDRRTRAQYLKWAPLLLAAEEYHAGVLRARRPGEDGTADDKRMSRFE